MTPLTLILYAGIPGSTKSTHAAAFLAEHPEYNLVCPDLYRQQLTGDMSDQSCSGYVFNRLVPDAIQAAARMSQGVVFDACNVSRKARKPILRAAKEYGYQVIARVMRTSYEDCVRRNAARDRVVPESVLARMHDAWVEPTLEEGFAAIEVIEVPLFALDTPPQAGETAVT